MKKELFAVVGRNWSDTRDTLEDSIYLKNKVCGANFIYRAHYEKSGYNTFVVLDQLVRKSDGTPL